MLRAEKSQLAGRRLKPGKDKNQPRFSDISSKQVLRQSHLEVIYPTLSLSLPGFSSGGGLRPQKQKVAVGTANHWGDFSVMSHWVVATLFGSPAFEPSPRTMCTGSNY